MKNKPKKESEGTRTKGSNPGGRTTNLTSIIPLQNHYFPTQFSAIEF